MAEYQMPAPKTPRTPRPRVPMKTFFGDLIEYVKDQVGKPMRRLRRGEVPLGYGHNGRGDFIAFKRNRRRELERVHGKLSGRQWRKLRRIQGDA